MKRMAKLISLVLMLSLLITSPALADLKRLADALMGRIRSNYRFIMGFNGTLIVLGAMGILPPATSALLHNVSTLGIGLRSMTPLLPAPPSGAQ